MIGHRECETDWSLKYRPTSVKNCILPSRLKSRLEQMVSARIIQNMTFHGSHGIGKTTTAVAVCHDAGSEPCLVNGCLENGIDNLRSLESFVCSRSFDGSKKVVVIDEAERLSGEYQDGLRGLIEQVSSNCSFILTTNNISRISGALKSRFIALDFSCPPEETTLLQKVFSHRMHQILAEEQATCEPALLADIIAAGFPDFRQIIKKLQWECCR